MISEYQIPCKDCITFPMCKSRTQKYINKSHVKKKHELTYSVNVSIITTLSRQCIYIEDYLHVPPDLLWNFKRMGLVAELFYNRE